MNDDLVLGYVKAAAAALDLRLDEARAQRVAQHLARTAALARLLEAAGLSVEDEPAEVFLSAPFPPAGERR
jgi:hypothetical protein